MRRLLARTLLFLVLLAAALSAADVNGIWTGQMPARRGEMEDVAFQFKLNGNSLTGKMFGDEFDLPLEDASLTGDQVKFTIITTNYYSGTKIKFTFTGVVNGAEMELTRQRVPSPTGENAAANRDGGKQTLKLKRLTP